MNSELDLIVVGGGPAGYAAGLYGARAGLHTAVIEQGMPGGQIATSDLIDNYPGIPQISGMDIGAQMHAHAEKAGALSAWGAVESIEREEDGLFSVHVNNEHLHAPSVIAAMGALPKKAGFEGEERFTGRGVSYCATCDGMFYKNKQVFVIGGGNTACEEALYLAHIAQEVTLLVRRDEFRAPRGMVERINRQKNIKVRYLTSILRLEGESFIERIVFRANDTRQETTEHFQPGSVGIFVAVGHDPQTQLIQIMVQLDATGAALTDETMATSTPGLFCAGDIRAKPLRQVITAAADGAIAAMSAYHYLDEQGFLG